MRMSSSTQFKPDSMQPSGHVAHPEACVWLEAEGAETCSTSSLVQSRRRLGPQQLTGRFYDIGIPKSLGLDVITAMSRMSTTSKALVKRAVMIFPLLPSRGLPSKIDVRTSFEIKNIPYDMANSKRHLPKEHELVDELIRSTSRDAPVIHRSSLRHVGHYQRHERLTYYRALTLCHSPSA